ncbi:MAG: cobalamin biosynthesis protein CobW [Verrucomicrobia bacterium Tous-C9LFEB]|nr:MAG: cobalamin biosynthesis protein CobW [Verrucomicrobia bacterium Tous-C9LFEB]
MNKPTPVTILTGFLGSGKTTLLNRLLTENHGKKIAVIENEYGEIGIDHDLVINSDEELFEMNNGCICCSVRGDLLRILGKLLRRKTPLDAVLIETTGLADPGPVIQTFYADEELQTRFSIDAIVTMVDTKHVLQHLEKDVECRKQIGFADIVLLNKTDLVSPAELDDLEQRLKGINGFARYYRTKDAEIEPEKIFGAGAFDLNKKFEFDPKVLDETAHTHNDSVSSVGFTLDRPLDINKIDHWMGKLLREKGGDIFRMKGILNIEGQPRKFVFQGVHMLFDGRPQAPWGESEKRQSRIVFIGQNLDRAALQKGFESCLFTS